MKRLLITIFILATLAGAAFGTLTYSVDVDSSQVTSYWWTGTPGVADVAWLHAKEVEDILEGTGSLSSLYFLPTDTPPTTNEGQLYYNDTANIFKFYNGSDWINMSSATGNSLDTAYDMGVGITVDNGAVTLTGSDAASNVLLALVQQDTDGSVAAVTVTSAGDAAAVIISQSGSGGDIQGTSSLWTVSKVGLGVYKGGLTINTGGELLVTARDVLFDDTYDVAWDTSRDTFIFQDNAILGIGGAHDAAPDVSFKWDTSNLLIESATEDTGEIRYGSTNAIDVAHYANSNSNIAKFNASTGTLEFNGYDVQVMDDDIVAYGDSDEFQTYYDENSTDNWIIVATNANDAVQIGDGTTNTDLKMMAATGSTYALWDSSADELLLVLADLKISQGSQIEFIDVTDDGTDWTVDMSTDEVLLFLPVETSNDQSFNIGNATYTSDFRLFGATASTVVYDSSADRVTYDVYDIEINDTSNLIIGSDDEFVIDNSTETLRIIPSDTTDDFAFHFGSATNTMDVIIYSSTGGETFTWDAGADSLTVVADLSLFTMTGTTLPFHVNVTSTVAGEAVKLETTNGGITLLADGSDNGDILLDSEDDMTFTSAGDLTFNITGTTTLPDNQLRRAVVAIGWADVDGLMGAPYELVATPGASAMLEFVCAVIALDYGATAYTESTDNLAIRYTDGSGVIVSEAIEATGFADATADTILFVAPLADGTNSIVAKTASVNKSLVLDNTGSGEWGNSGDSPIVVIIYYRIHTTTELGL